MKRGTCETCGCPDAQLHEGMCAPCCARFGVEIAFMTTERMLEIMSRHIGAANGLSIAELVTEMSQPKLVAAPDRAHLERSARDIVVQLRMQGHHVCSHPSSGYFMASTPEELDAACAFLYERAMTSLGQVAAMKRVSLPDLRGQLHLPT